eukprot:3667310-Amphidinium_carterae.1
MSPGCLGQEEEDDILSLAEHMAFRMCINNAVSILNERDVDCLFFHEVRRFCLAFVHWHRRSALALLPFLPLECTMSEERMSFPEYWRALASIDVPFAPSFYILEDVVHWNSLPVHQKGQQQLKPAVLLPKHNAFTLQALIVEACVTDLHHLAVPDIVIEQPPA